MAAGDAGGDVEGEEGLADPRGPGDERELVAWEDEGPEPGRGIVLEGGVVRALDGGECLEGVGWCGGGHDGVVLDTLTNVVKEVRVGNEVGVGRGAWGRPRRWVARACAG